MSPAQLRSLALALALALAAAAAAAAPGSAPRPRTRRQLADDDALQPLDVSPALYFHVYRFRRRSGPRPCPRRASASEDTEDYQKRNADELLSCETSVPKTGGASRVYHSLDSIITKLVAAHAFIM